MLNVTEFTNATANLTRDKLIEYTSYEIFLAPVFIDWVIVLVLTLIIGLTFVKGDRENFWAIFLLTHLILFILLFFTFVFPIIPQLLDNWGIANISSLFGG